MIYFYRLKAKSLIIKRKYNSQTDLGFCYPSARFLIARYIWSIFYHFLQRRHLVRLQVCFPVHQAPYKTFLMLNSAEHDIFSANKYENANNSWHFHIN